VAEALFARRGFSGVGMQEVADAVGLGKSSLFHHFRSKAQLYCEVLVRVFDRIEAHLAPVYACDAGPVERLERWVDAAVDALAEHPTTARLLLRGLFEDEGDDIPDDLPEAQAAEGRVAALFRDLQRMLREGVDAGAFRRVSVAHAVQTLIGATLYHFASGELGESLLGRPLLSSEAVRRRKQELRSLLTGGLAAPAAG
jgi:AcrR family transcriptional regulator